MSGCPTSPKSSCTSPRLRTDRDRAEHERGIDIRGSSGRGRKGKSMKLSGVRTCCAAALASLALMAASSVPAWAASCGDKAGPGKTRVACACGDTVITDTALKPGDPIVDALCSDVGLTIGADHVTLNCNGRGFAGTTGQGIVLSGRTGVVVRSCTVVAIRSEERRVGKECRSRWSP